MRFLCFPFVYSAVPPQEGEGASKRMSGSNRES